MEKMHCHQMNSFRLFIFKSINLKSLQKLELNNSSQSKYNNRHIRSENKYLDLNGRNNELSWLFGRMDRSKKPLNGSRKSQAKKNS